MLNELDEEDARGFRKPRDVEGTLLLESVMAEISVVIRDDEDHPDVLGMLLKRRCREDSERGLELR
jgi:hypothetical protein